MDAREVGGSPGWLRLHALIDVKISSRRPNRRLIEERVARELSLAQARGFLPVQDEAFIIRQSF